MGQRAGRNRLAMSMDQRSKRPVSAALVSEAEMEVQVIRVALESSRI
ncbi:hypothetical protein YSY43_37520 [Paenibacillus sp. YSY-4.3]